MTSLSSGELNFIVFRYLQEPGFTHAAFAIGHEAGINKSTIDESLIPPGGLITFVQKGLQCVEREANFGSSEADVDEALIQNDVKQLRKWVKDRNKELQKDRDKDKKLEKEHEAERERTRVRGKERTAREKESEKRRVRVEKNKEQEKHHKYHNDKNKVTEKIEKINGNHEENVYGVRRRGRSRSNMTSFSSVMLPTNSHFLRLDSLLLA